MKYYYLLCITLFFFSCDSNNLQLKRDSNEVAWNDKVWTIEVTDTVRVKFVRNLLRIYDTSPDRSKHLLMSAFENNEIVVMDDSGKVLANHKPVGQGNELVGETMFGLGFLGNDKFIVSSQKGFYVYDLLSGHYLESYPLRTSMRGYEAFEANNIEAFQKEGSLHFATGLRSSLEDKDILRFRKEYFEDFHPITFMNTSTNTASLNFGIGPTSRYKRLDYHYGEIYTLFDYASSAQLFATVTNPSDELSIWDVESGLIREIPLRFEHFKLPIKFKYGNGSIDDATQVVNSMYRTLNIQGSEALLVYKTGLPLEDFRGISSEAEIPALFRQKMKYYGSLIDIETGTVSKEFKLPKYAVGVASFTSHDNLLLYTNPSIADNDSTYMFFRAQLKEIE